MTTLKKIILILGAAAVVTAVVNVPEPPDYGTTETVICHVMTCEGPRGFTNTTTCNGETVETTATDASDLGECYITKRWEATRTL